MKKCLKCGREVPEGNNFCPYCGEVLVFEKKKSRKKRIIRPFLEKLYPYQNKFAWAAFAGLAIFIMCLIAYDIADEMLRQAASHYRVAVERENWLGCGIESCTYCQGIKTWGKSMYFFPYYSKVSIIKDIFSSIAILAICLAIVLLVLCILVKKVAKNAKVARLTMNTNFYVKRLKQYKELQTLGVITEEEFEEVKNELLKYI